MPSFVRFALPLLAPVLFGLMSGCGSNGPTVGASPSLAGNWNIAATAASTSASQIAGVGGALMVSGSGAITGMLHALPAAGNASSSLCYATANAIPVTGSITADSTLTLTSSSFAGNTLTVRGTYMAGSGGGLPSMSNATYSIAGPCGVAAQAVAATQVPTLSGTYTGNARFGTNPGYVNWTTVFTQSTSPDAFGGYPLIGTSTFAADPCIVTPVAVNVTTSNVQYGTYISEDFVDASTNTEVTAEGISTDLTNATIALNSIKLTNTTTAYAYCNDSGTGYLSKNGVIFAPAATPVLSLAAGTYTSVQTVSITSTTSGASIYYTTDGSVPTTSSTLYTGPVTVSASETLAAIATGGGSSSSPVASAAYVINLPAAATPVFSVVAGTYTSSQAVSITSATSGAQIYYTVNGSVPTTSSTLYGGPITVSNSETINAIAIGTGFNSSPVASAAYVINAPATLTFSTTNVAFPPTAVGFQAVPLTFTISNASAAPVTFNGFAVAGLNGSDFAQVSNCGLPLQPNQSCTVTITATPGALGNRAAIFMVSSDAPGSPQTVSLTVTGKTANAGPASLSLSQLNWVAAGVTQDITLQNSGTTPLTIKSIASSDSSFVVSGNNCGTFLPAQSICTISIVSNGATPSGYGFDVTYSGTLTVRDDNATGFQTAALSSTNTQTLLSSPFASSPVGVPVTMQFGAVATSRDDQPNVQSVITGVNAGDFSLSPNGCMSGFNSAPVPCHYNVTFTPSAGGIRTARLIPGIPYSIPGYYIPLTGSAPGAPGTAFTAPTTLLLGAKFDSSGHVSGSAPLSVLNTGTAPLSFASYPLTGANPIGFSATGNCMSIAAGASCTVTVSYSGTTPANGTLSLLLQDTASGTSQNVAIAASTTYQGLKITPPSLSFGPQVAGTISPAQTFTVGDSNGLPLGHALTATVLYAQPNFTITQGATCPASTAQLCTVGVDFTAGNAGMTLADILVQDLVSGNTAYAEVTGIAVGTPTVSLSTTSAVFPQRAVGSTSVPMVVMLTNSGTASLTVSGVNVTGAVANNFSQSNTCSTVAAGATCVINVTFAPTSAGSQTAAIRIVSNAGSSPDSVQLSGSAQ